MNLLRGHFYNNERADLAQFTFFEKCSIIAYILKNEDYQKIKREKFFRVCSCNLQDPDATVFQNKPITLVDQFGFFTIEGFKLLITVAKIIKIEFINELIIL